MMTAAVVFFAFIVGLALGSFMNVVISRVPRGESLVRPRSHCLSCGRELEWYENVPVVSYVALRGKCRTCGAAIGLRYLAVELAFGLLAAAAAGRIMAQAALAGGGSGNG